VSGGAILTRRRLLFWQADARFGICPICGRNSHLLHTDMRASGGEWRGGLPRWIGMAIAKSSLLAAL
jgi:hypothetical protein